MKGKKAKARLKPAKKSVPPVRQTLRSRDETESIKRQKTFLNQKELKEMKQLLLDLKTDLTGSIKDIQGETTKTLTDRTGGTSTHGHDHPADLSSEVYEQDFAIDMVEKESGELADIMDALKKIEEEIFGYCEKCDGRISMERLKAMPHARLCIECKKQADENV